MGLTNLPILKEKVDSSGLKAKFIYEKLGISKSVWSQRLSGRSQFKKDEIVILGELLKLSNKDLRQIFFAPDVVLMGTKYNEV